MAKKKEQVVEQTTEQPKVDDKVEKLKIKKKPKKFVPDKGEPIKVDLKELTKKAEEITKVDLSKKEDANTEQTTTDVATDKPAEVIQEVEEKVSQEQDAVQDEKPIIEEVVEPEKVEEVTKVVEEKIEESIETGKELPEGIQKLMSFMEDTGGDVNDYVNLNKDYSEMDNDTLLREYYKETKPHLSHEEVNFLMEDKFSYDENDDEERDIKRKKLALKEQVADAKNHLDGLKSKYYEDIKAGSKLTSDQQKAIDFFSRYNKESEAKKAEQETAKKVFLNKTENVFNDEFKGFEYKVGDKRFRFNVKDTNEVKESQSDINNFVGKFLNEKSLMEDASGYHKGLFTAMNSDAIANHFY